MDHPTHFTNLDTWRPIDNDNLDETWPTINFNNPDDSITTLKPANEDLMDELLQCEKRKLTPRRVVNKGKRKVLEEDDVEAFVESELEDDMDGCELSGDECDSVHSDNSLECDDQIGEELHYDVDELILFREMNLNMRREEKNRIGPSTTTESYENDNTHNSPTPITESIGGIQTMEGELKSGKTVPLSKWPSFWTTYEGGYQSDQRDTDDEEPFTNDEEEEFEVEEEMVKTKKGKVKLDYPFFNEKTDMRNVYFEVGLRFQSQKVLKDAILWYSIQQKKDIRYLKNDKKRIHVGCHGCMWEMSVGNDLDNKGAWQIKALRGEHRCVRTFKNKMISENWLAEQYLDKILRNPKMTSKEIKDDVKSRYDILVHTKMCVRAKNNALTAVNNLMKRQYGILKPYLLELCRSNPNTTCVLKTLEAPRGQPAIFHRFYVCFAALKRSFTETCRPIIGVDGCFLKHACGGQLLCAVGRDGNNQMYPIAWAVVEVENKNNWDWFLRLVGEDLNMELGDGWTVISDQQKGLIPSIHALWPNIEHRQCARHILSNWRKVHKGMELQRQFWRCVKATTKGQFYAEADDLRTLCPDAYAAFMLQDPSTFCKSHFRTTSQCDVVDNNMAETFNSFILLARYKPIISMFEDMRLALMDRMKLKKELASKFVAGVAPRISEKMEEAYNEQRQCECRWNGSDNQSGFEVLHNGISHAIDLEKRICSCRVWDLTGIPCCHAMSAILYMNKQPEDYIAKWYKVETYNQTYSWLLQPVRGSIFWDHDGAGMVLPPSIERRKPGRRKTNRRKAFDEPKKKAAYSRKGLPIKCSNCGGTGHDIRKCALPRKVASTKTNQKDPINPPSNRGRPKGSKNRIGRDDIMTTAQCLSSRRKTKDSNEVVQPDKHYNSWLSSVTTTRGSRGRTSIRGRAHALGGRGKLPSVGGIGRAPAFAGHGGMGLYHGDQGEVVFRSAAHRPGIVIRDVQSQP